MSAAANTLPRDSQVSFTRTARKRRSAAKAKAETKPDIARERPAAQQSATERCGRGTGAWPPNTWWP